MTKQSYIFRNNKTKEKFKFNYNNSGIITSSIIFMDNSNNWAIFDIRPSHILFNNYEKNAEYKQKISIINQDTIALEAEILFDITKDLSLSLGDCIKNEQLITPKQHIYLEITFQPNIDYKNQLIDRRHEIVIYCNWKRIKYVIPVFILSAGPSINFPSEILMPDTTPNVPSYSTMLINNKSSIDFEFSFGKTSKCVHLELSITPLSEKIKIKSNEYKIFFIEVIPRTISDFILTIPIIYHSDPPDGTSTDIVLKCTSTKRDILMEPSKIIFEQVWLNCQDKKSVILTNNGFQDVHFKWLIKDINKINDGEEYFEIIPKTGEIHPQSTIELSAIFHPPINLEKEHCINNYGSDINTTAFLLTTNTTGKNDKFDLVLAGSYFGANITLNCHQEQKYIGSLYLEHPKEFEVECSNVGEIEGIIRFQDTEELLNGKIEIIPQFQSLMPKETGIFKIIYIGQQVGRFLEKISFSIDCGNPRIQYFTISGEVLPLELSFNPDVINFGNIPVGSQDQKRNLTILNWFDFSVDIYIKIKKFCEDCTFIDLRQKTPEDCDLMPIMENDQKTPPDLYNFKLSAKQKCDLEIKLITYWQGRERNFLEFYTYTLKNNRKFHQFGQFDIKPQIVPLYHYCVIPEIHLLENVFSIETFVNVEYPLQLILQNKDQYFPGICHISAEIIKANKNYKIEIIEPISQDKKIFIKPQENFTILLKITTLIRGNFSMNLQIDIVGKPDGIPFKINCTSKPQLLVVEPQKVINNNVEIYEEQEILLFIKNPSSQRVSFKVRWQENDEKFSCFPMDGILEANDGVFLICKTLFNYPDCYKNKLEIQVIGGDAVVKVPFKFIAIGVPLIFQPSSAKTCIDFGTILTSPVGQFSKFSITNSGISTVKFFYNNAESERKMDKNFKPKFTIMPDNFTIKPQGSVDISVGIRQIYPGEIEEIFYLYEGEMKNRRKLFHTTIRANVIQPFLKWNKDFIEFQWNWSKDENAEQLINDFVIKNYSKLPLPVMFIVVGEYRLKIFNDDVNAEEDEKWWKKIQITLEPNMMKRILVRCKQQYFEKHKMFHSNEGKIKIISCDCSQGKITIMSKFHWPQIDISDESRDIIIYSEKHEAEFMLTMSNPTEINADYKFVVVSETFMMTPIANHQDDKNEKIEKNSSVSLPSQASSKNNSDSLKVTPRDFLNLSELQGTLESQQIQQICIKYNAIKDSLTYNYYFKLKLEVAGGNVEEFDCKIYNTTPALQIFPCDFNFGKVSCRKTLIDFIQLENLCEIPLEVEFIKDLEYSPAIFNFHFPEEKMVLPSNEIRKIGFDLNTGRPGNFQYNLNILLNGKHDNFVSIVGEGFLPNCHLLDADRPGMLKLSRVLEYNFLMKLYNTILSADIEMSHQSKDLSVPEEVASQQSVEEIKKKSKKSKKKEKKGKNSKRSDEKVLKKSRKGRKSEKSLEILEDEVDQYMDESLMRPVITNKCRIIMKSIDFSNKSILNDPDLVDYDVLEYPDSFPNVIEFLNYIQEQLLINALNKYSKKATAPLSSCNNTADKIQPFDFKAPQYEIDLGQVTMGETINYKFKIFYEKPTILQMNIRTNHFLSGLKIHCDTEGDEYSVKNFIPNIIRHSHSFDFTSDTRAHARKSPSGPEKKSIQQHYTMVSRIMKREKIDPLLLCEVMEQDDVDGPQQDKRIVNFLLEFTPIEEDYKNVVEINEFFFINLHMGLKIPVNLQARLIKNKIADKGNPKHEQKK